MKIMLVTSSLKLGGKEKQIIHLFNGLKKYKIDTKLVLFSALIDRDTINAESVLVLKNKSVLLATLSLLKEIFKYKPTIIHTWEHRTTTICILLKIFFRYKIIDGEIRFSRSLDSFRLFKYQRFLNTRLSTVVVANTLIGLKNFKLVENFRARVIPNGFDIESFDKVDKSNLLEHNEDYIYIGKIANFTKPKDYLIIVKVIDKILSTHANVKFIFVGDGPEYLSIKKRINPTWSDRVLFLGKRIDVDAIVKCFDIGLLLSKPGHSEGMSNSIMEYMAASLPVIATNTGGNTILINNEINGYLIPHGDYISLTDCLERLISDKELRLRMGGINRTLLQERYDIDKMVSKYISLYKEVK